MKKIAFLGGGKIGRTMLSHVIENHSAEPMFVFDPFLEEENIMGVRVVKELSEELFAGLDLVVECATAEVLKVYGESILKYCNLMPFSMTAFREEALYKAMVSAAQSFGTHLYLPHGAILGLDGIFDGKSIITEVVVETTKNPKSLGRDDDVKTVLFEGSTREATELYPRNVNVHAAIALAGIGFDRTKSKITADPAVSTNTHQIHILGQGIDFSITVSSFSEGGVSGKYVPLSACGSIDRVLGGKAVAFV